MPIKVRTTNAFVNGLTAGTTNAGEGSPRVSATPLTHSELDDNITSVWPIGSVYFNASDNRNPRQIIGYGHWMAFGKQTILVGRNNSPATSSQPETTFSRRIVAASVSTNPSRNQSKLVLRFSTDNSPFSVGQKVTIKGITGSSGINPNREREILNLGDAAGNNTHNRITVDYRSPNANPNIKDAVLGKNETLGASNASATLFGTRYNLDSPAMKYGKGGTISENILQSQMPSHHHSTDWDIMTTRHKLTGSGIPTSLQRAPIVGGSSATGTQTTQMVTYNVQDPMRLAAVVGSYKGAFGDPVKDFLDVSVYGNPFGQFEVYIEYGGRGYAPNAEIAFTGMYRPGVTGTYNVNNQPDFGGNTWLPAGTGIFGNEVGLLPLTLVAKTNSNGVVTHIKNTLNGYFGGGYPYGFANTMWVLAPEIFKTRTESIGLPYYSFNIPQPDPTINAANITFKSSHIGNSLNNDYFEMSSTFTINNGGGGFSVGDVISIPLKSTKTMTYTDDDDRDSIHTAYLQLISNPTFRVNSVGTNGTITGISIQTVGKFRYSTQVIDANEIEGFDFFGTGTSFSEMGSRNKNEAFTIASTAKSFTVEEDVLGADITTSSSDDIKSSGRGFRTGQGTRLSNGTYGFAHENLMPFIGAYMWLRIM